LCAPSSPSRLRAALTDVPGLALPPGDVDPFITFSLHFIHFLSNTFILLHISVYTFLLFFWKTRSLIEDVSRRVQDEIRGTRRPCKNWINQIGVYNRLSLVKGEGKAR
jgi:hypothetical protein